MCRRDTSVVCRYGFSQCQIPPVSSERAVRKSKSSGVAFSARRPPRLMASVCRMCVCVTWSGGAFLGHHRNYAEVCWGIVDQQLVLPLPSGSQLVCRCAGVSECACHGFVSWCGTLLLPGEERSAKAEWLGGSVHGSRCVTIEVRISTGGSGLACQKASCDTSVVEAILNAASPLTVVAVPRRGLPWQQRHSPMGGPVPERDHRHL